MIRYLEKYYPDNLGAEILKLRDGLQNTIKEHSLLIADIVEEDSAIHRRMTRDSPLRIEDTTEENFMYPEEIMKERSLSSPDINDEQIFHEKVKESKNDNRLKKVSRKHDNTNHIYDYDIMINGDDINYDTDTHALNIGKHDTNNYAKDTERTSNYRLFERHLKTKKEKMKNDSEKWEKIHSGYLVFLSEALRVSR